MMKSVYHILLIILSLNTIDAMAQGEHPYIKNLKASMTGSQVYVSWTTKAGFSCQDIEVQLATLSNPFTTKAIYYGICGDTAERDYNILLDSPFVNQVNILRLDLGSFGYSDQIEFFALNIDGAEVFPNPINENSLLRIENTNREMLSLEIWNYLGEIVVQENVDQGEIELWSFGLTNGWYYYWIYREDKLIGRGKFIK